MSSKTTLLQNLRPEKVGNSLPTFFVVGHSAMEESPLQAILVTSCWALS